MTPRTDNPFADLATGAWAYVWVLCLTGFVLSLFAERRI